METVLAAALVGVLGYTVWRETKAEQEETARPPNPSASVIT